MASEVVALTKSESSQLKRLEGIIEKGITTFVEVGRALAAIRGERLYRVEHKSFEEYVKARWGWTRGRAYQLIEASAAADNVSTAVDIKPTSERQVRPLAGLPPEKQREAWGKAASAAKVKRAKVTGEDVEKVVRAIVTYEPPPVEKVVRAFVVETHPPVEEVLTPVVVEHAALDEANVANAALEGMRKAAEVLDDYFVKREKDLSKSNREKLGNAFGKLWDLSGAWRGLPDEDEQERRASNYRIIITDIEGTRLASVQKKVNEAFRVAFPDSHFEVEVEKLGGGRGGRAARYSEAASTFESAKETIEELHGEIESWKENLPENLQGGTKAEELDECLSQLGDLIDALEGVEFPEVEFPGMFS